MMPPAGIDKAEELVYSPPALRSEHPIMPVMRSSTAADFRKGKWSFT